MYREFTSPGQLGYRQDQVAKHNVMVGGITEGSGTTKRLMCSTMSLQDAVFALSNDSPSGWVNTGLISLDGLYCPFSTDSGSLLPHFEQPTDSEIHPNVDDLNPFGNKYARTTTEFVISGDSITNDTTLSTKDNSWYNARKIRAVSLKAPLVLTGWGYDTNNKPVPNKNLSGVITNNFAEDYPLHPELWKSGPVDLRWNNNKKVWVAGSITQLGKVIGHSGVNVHNLPLYDVGLAKHFQSGIITELESSSSLIVNIQEAGGDKHTIGIGSYVIVHEFDGEKFMNEHVRTLIRRTAYNG
jgi:hypothetical protein